MHNRLKGIGALLFLIHMIAKFQPWQPGNRDKPGSRIAIVFNGGAGSGESEIRRWIIEHDWLEAIAALPEQMFYNTGIGTFVWVLSNRKEAHRKGKIQLINARERWTPMKRSLGNKRRWLDEKEDIISYVLREVRPYVADAWIDRDTLDEQDGGIGKVGYEINFNREFFQYQASRPLAEIDAELEAVEKRIMALLREVTE